MVALVGVIRLLVVFVLVSPEVVVHVNTEEEFGPIYRKAQERLFVVRDRVGAHSAVVLVDVGYEVVVLVPTRKDLAVGEGPVGAEAVWHPVLIVVVFHEVHETAVVLVVDAAVVLGDESLGVVARVHVIGFAVDEEAGPLARQVEHIGWCVALTDNAS